MALTAFTVQTEAELAAVWRLTLDVYGAEGYLAEDSMGKNASRTLAHHAYFDMTAETEVYAVADEAGNILATNSATIDGPRGLHTDKTFPYETDAVRRECYNMKLRLGSSWRIVTAPVCRNRPQAAMLVIDRTLKEFGKKIDVCLFTFHPKHTKIYERMLELKIITGPKPDTTVNGSPAVLMRGETPAMLAAWASGPGRRL